IFGSDGLINQVLAIFGINGPTWIADPDFALGTLIVLNVWTFGSPMVIFLAGLRQIPQMYYEAASIDGASKWKQFRSVTMPLLTPIIGSSGSRVKVGSESAGLEERSCDVVGEVAEPESRAAQVLQSSIDRLGRSVGGAGAVEVGQHICGASLQRPSEFAQLAQGGGNAVAQVLDQLAHQLLAA